MPQKKTKKNKEKVKKSVKGGAKAPKKAGPALKKAAKPAKKAGSSANGKKAASKKALPKPPKKDLKSTKKVPLPKAAKKKAAPAPKAAKEAAVKPAKGKVKVAAPKANGKKKAEVVLEVPAPKGVALLGREGKKKGKSSESSASSKKRCREPGCDNDLLLSGYCRLHYIKNWRKIKRKEAILASGQLNNYVEELVNKYPDRYLDVIRQDLASEKDWVKVVVDLELESADEESAGDEDLEGVAEGVRRDREYDDDSDSF